MESQLLEILFSVAAVAVCGWAVFRPEREEVQYLERIRKAKKP